MKMSLYIDVHAKMPPIPDEAIEQANQGVGSPGPEGVRTLEVVFTKDDRAYCMTEAPSAEAVCRAHEAKGMLLDQGDVHEIVARALV
jgi:hypothetical protein